MEDREIGGTALATRRWIAPPIGIAVAMVLLLLGCAGGHSLGVEGVKQSIPSDTVKLVYGGSSVGVSLGVARRLMRKIEQRLFDERQYSRSGGLTVTYRFTQFDPGGRYNLWFMIDMDLADSGAITVDVTYADGDGRHLGAFEVVGDLGHNFFGKPFDPTLDYIADAVAQYTVEHFN